MDNKGSFLIRSMKIGVGKQKWYFYYGHNFYYFLYWIGFFNRLNLEKGFLKRKSQRTVHKGVVCLHQWENEGLIKFYITN
jgi:hypothetical protein